MIDEKNIKTIPDSIKEKILELKALEMNLGHLPPENITVADLYKRIEEQSSEQMEKQTEILFSEICEALIEHNYNESEIVTEINSIVCYVGGPRYCNEQEVREALGK
jgi:hypothetical protein